MTQFPFLTGAVLAAALLPACTSVAPVQPAASRTLACDDGIKTSFKPDANTTVVSVRRVAKGEQIIAVDSTTPVTIARDMCLVKLLVGPGSTATERDRSARSYSEGIGMEVWLPERAGWNERIRNYGGGGWVGGGHRYADKIGSKLPALANANMGYASSTHDGGQPHYQDASFAFLSSGSINQDSFWDMNSRAIHEQAIKTRALVEAYYGRAPRFSYYDGHSQGGRQGLKAAQEWPEQYDGFLIGQPAVSVPKFSLSSLYPQVVMKMELGFTALDKPAATAFARKVAAVNARAVASCDREKLGFLLDPAACTYDPLREAEALCTSAVGEGVLGTNADAATCMSPKEALALNKIWHGPTSDGSYVPVSNQSYANRSGAVLGPKQLWWGFPRGSSLNGVITGASTDMLAIAMADVRYAGDANAGGGTPITNTSTPVRNRWQELTYASYADAFQRVSAQQMLRDYMTDKPELAQFRRLGRKMILWSGLAEDVIPPQGSVNYYERVKAAAGGDAETQKFLRMYNMPGMAHSSQGRASTVGGNNNIVPMPMLPGNANQNPTPEQDPLFSALVDWVERGVAPEQIVIRSRDNATAYPICVYPKKITWNGSGPAKEAGSYSCK
ncbi:tannase/feruloyl esterase family alpha/beta hydrolase [Ramlibacter sp. PS3R-8]|uniref:tannase/feruloyl esterase family alpha/beta hydrolase n=1 Tax=Ramlibacter sp. PS3R-8 TaxID=3133437 RepID=UPI0030AFCF40